MNKKKTYCALRCPRAARPATKPQTAPPRVHLLIQLFFDVRPVDFDRPRAQVQFLADLSHPSLSSPISLPRPPANVSAILLCWNQGLIVDLT